MSDVGLMFVGAVLFVNGLLLLGKVDSKGAAVFNLFVGALQVAVPFYLIATAPSVSDILLDSGIFLFGFTYLYVGISNLAGHSPVGLGWYSAWVAIMATAFGVTNIVKFHDPTIGLLWLQWAVLWGLFWLVLGLGLTRLTALTGWLTLILSFTTCTIPGYLLLLGEWGHVPTWLVGVVIAATAVALIPAARQSLRPATETADPRPARETAAAGSGA
jgi:putative amide transporter protein